MLEIAVEEPSLPWGPSHVTLTQVMIITSISKRRRRRRMMMMFPSVPY
jgi:hypothetical protein